MITPFVLSFSLHNAVPQNSEGYMLLDLLAENSKTVPISTFLLFLPLPLLLSLLQFKWPTSKAAISLGPVVRPKGGSVHIARTFICTGS